MTLALEVGGGEIRGCLVIRDLQRVVLNSRKRAKGGDTWGNRAEREVRNGKGKREGESGSGICRGRRRMGGRVGMSNGISPNEDKSKEKWDGYRVDGLR